jgi:hypothetical protein
MNIAKIYSKGAIFPDIKKLAAKIPENGVRKKNISL